MKKGQGKLRVYVGFPPKEDETKIFDGIPGWKANITL